MPFELVAYFRRFLADRRRGWNRRHPTSPCAVAPPRRLPPQRESSPVTFRRRRLWRRRTAFTLLEIILALAILAGSLAVLGEVIRSATENGARAREETQAQLLAASLMAELSASSATPSSVSGAPVQIEADPPWTYSVDVEPTADIGLLLVRVTVDQDTPPSRGPDVTYSLTRWVLDPASLPVEVASEGTSAASTTTSAASAASAGGDSGDTGTPSTGR